MSDSKIHGVKVWPEYFNAIIDGRKKFEFRINDRDYRVGDVLDLQEFEPGGHKFTGRSILAEITYALFAPGWGLPENSVILSISVRDRKKEMSGAV